MASFSHLSAQETPTAEELVTTLREYATQGKIIAPDLVMDIAQKASCSRAQLADCIRSAREGETLFRTLNDGEMAARYEHVRTRLTAWLPKEGDFDTAQSGDAVPQ